MARPPSFLGIWREDHRARAAYSEGAGIYRILPSAVAVPSTTNDLARLVRWARAENVALTPRGAGSGMPGHNVGSGVVVDLNALDGRPIRIDTTGFEATTGAAVSLGELADEAARVGLRMPVDPSSARFATAGGTVSTNAGGPRSVKYGPVRRWVRGLAMVTADGELLRLERGVPTPDSALTRRFTPSADCLRLARRQVGSTFPKVRKNTAGYALDAFLESGDLLDLIIGSEGTLGIITEVHWRLEPIPPARMAARAAIREVERLSQVVPGLLSLDPARVEFLDTSFLRFAGSAIQPLTAADRITDAGAMLLVEFEGASVSGLEGQIERAVGVLGPESTEVIVGADDTELEDLWSVRRAASSKLAQLEPELRSLQIIEDGCVPVDRLDDYVVGVRSAAKDHGLQVVLFGHAGDGNVHANVLANLDNEDMVVSLRAMYDDVSRLVVALGGTPSGEHGDGRLRAPLLERVYGLEVLELFQQLKRAFDPTGIFNPGVKLTGSKTTPVSSLKVGANAVPIPADVEAGLRWIERQGGYGCGRLAIADDPSTWAAVG